MIPSQCRRGSDPRPAAATGLGPRKPGDPRALRTYLRRLQRKPDGDADDPAYNLHQAARRLWMPKGKTVEEETACPKRGIRQKILKTEELSETGARLGKPICAECYRRIKP